MGSMIARRLMSPVLVVACAFVGTLGFTGTPALALETHHLEAGFGPDGTSASFFERPTSLAVDQTTGNLYVGDAAGHTLQKFDVAHEPEAFTGFAPNIVAGKLTGFGVHLAAQLAVDSASHDLYVAGDSESVRAYEANGEPADFTAGPGAGSDEILGSEVCGVAVGANSDIYMSEYANGIRVFKHDGEPVTTIPVGGVCNLAVDSHGNVYANSMEDPEGGNSGPIQKLTPGPALKLIPSEYPATVASTYEASTVDPNHSFTVAVDPSTDHLYVDEGSRIAEYDENGNMLDTFGASEPGALATPNGWGAAVAINGVSGQLYVAQGNAEAQVEIFGPLLLLPDVTTGKASAIDPKGDVTLNGTVDPDGVQVSECYFEYGTSTSYGDTAACEQTVGAGSGEVAVSAKLNDLPLA